MAITSSVIFTKDDSINDIIQEDFNILTILSRIPIPLGFGSGSIDNICRENGVPTDLFLLIVNFAISRSIDLSSVTSSSVLGLVEFLHNSHDYFLTYKYPHIRANLLNALDGNHSSINPVIVRFFDQYVCLVEKHFHYEESVLYPYIRSLVNGYKSPDYDIATFARNHERISDTLSDLKNIILQGYSTSIPYRMHDVVVDLFNCEEDLQIHTDIENHILVPLICRLESKQIDTTTSFECQ